MIRENATLHLVFLVIYLVSLVALGAWKARKVKTQEDFALAGRGLSTFVLVGTLLATWIGTGSIFGNAEKTYQIGMGGFLIPLGGVLGILLLYAIAARIRRFGQFTLQDMLEARFGTLTRILATLTLVAAYLIIVSYQYRAGQRVLAYLFPEANPNLLLTGVAAFVILYTAMAGMFSVAYTDVANGVLMLIGIACAIPYLMAESHGWKEMMASMPGLDRQFFGHWDALKLLGATLPAFLLVLGDANMVQRFFSAKDPRSAKRAAMGMFFGVLLMETMIILVAFLGAGLVHENRIAAPEKSGDIIIHLAFTALPPFLGAMLVATVVAVVVSTADSYLLSPATSLVRDVYQRFIDPKASERQLVLAGRGIVVLLGVTALFLSTQSKGFFRIALFAYTIYGAGITPVVLAAYFWPRANQAGAIASMATGVGVAFFWWWVMEFAVGTPEAPRTGALADLGRWAGAEGVDPVLPAVLLALPVLVGVSLATKPPSSARASTL